MATFDEATKSWAEIINDWYALDCTAVDVADAFFSKYRDKVAHDGTSYADMFFRNRDGSWSEHLDTADREGLADVIERERGNRPLPTYDDLTGNGLLNKVRVS